MITRKRVFLNKGFARLVVPAVWLMLNACPGLASDDPQTPPQGAESGAAAGAKPAPPKMKWNAHVTAAVQLNRGQTDANSYNLSGALGRSSGARSYLLEANLMFSSVRVPGAPSRFTAMDRRYCDFLLYQKISPRMAFISRTSEEHDLLRGVTNRFENLAGIGFQPAIHERVSLIAGPGLDLGVQDRIGITKSSRFMGPGFYQALSVQINKAWSLSQRFVATMNAGDTRDHRLDGNIALTGMVIGRRVGLTIAYSHTDDGIVSPGLIRSYSQLTTGLRYAIQ